MIHYSISSSQPAAHYFDIELNIPEPDPAGQVLRMPAWIPGSYMIRDFARQIFELSAVCDGHPVTLLQLDKSSWKLEPCSGELRIKYRVYAWDLSVRSAHLDTTHGFFNGSSVFLEVIGQSHFTLYARDSLPAGCECSRLETGDYLEPENRVTVSPERMGVWAFSGRGLPGTH